MTRTAARVLNFASGPAMMPEAVLHQLQEDLVSLDGSGIGVLEIPHRSARFDRVLDDALDAVREVGMIGPDHEVLFLQGGATLHFALIPMNWLRPGSFAAFVNTGTWPEKAMHEAQRLGDARSAFDGAAQKWSRLPRASEVAPHDGAAYLHYCANNTIEGTQFASPPETESPRVVDLSSELFSRRVDWNAHGFAFACAQKNFGPSGNVVAIVRKDFLAVARSDVPHILSYREHAAAGSRLNTPNTFGIRAMALMGRWIQREGGVDEMARRAERRASLLYGAIDASDGFYVGAAAPDSRSRMNVVFRLANAALESRFLADAEREGLTGLAGHRSVGGLRASIYNAMPVSGCEALASFMRDFARRA